MNLRESLLELYKLDEEKVSEELWQIISALGNFIDFELKGNIIDKYILTLIDKNGNTYTIEYNEGAINIKSRCKDDKKLEIIINSQLLFLLSKKEENDEVVEESIKLEYTDKKPNRLTISISKTKDTSSISNEETIIEPDTLFPELIVIEKLQDGVSLGKRVFFRTIEKSIEDKTSKETFDRILCNIDRILPFKKNILDFLLEELSSENFQRLQQFMSNKGNIQSTKEKTVING
jgi:hypothetical protein